MANGTGARALLPILSSAPVHALTLRYAAVLAFTLFLGACASPRGPSNLDQGQARADTTPMVAAVRHGDLDRVQALAGDGASLNTVTEQGTPLFVAAEAGHARITWFLLSEGASPDLVTESGMTPLMVASLKGHRQIVALLLSAGAGVNAASEAGDTPIFLAAREGNLSVVKALLSAGANVNVSQGDHSLLMQVVEGGDLLMAEVLLAAGADPGYKGPDGLTALAIARQNNSRELQMLLIQAGAGS
ncbi:ankyrin repeat domain-containing protein [Marinobacter sp.]|uniref:ankyrin repeat domain-containing protein n=1 Tax=Marinobacter sp. TaxID=50741 RepID=UPI00384F95BC